MNKLMSLLVGLTLTLASLVAHADEYADFDPAAAKSQISAPLFVTISYGAIWALVMLFALMIWRRQQRLDKELAAANARLAELMQRAGDGESQG